MDDLYNDLLVELECPICTNYMTPPIRQCGTGHSLCESCRKKLPRCPLCQGPFTDAKNLSLEALASKMQYPCINRPTGCDAKLSLSQRETHEMNCTYKGFKCAMDRCPWVGKLEDVAEHWASKKTKSKAYLSFNVCHTKIKSDLYYANMVEAHDQLFWFKCKLDRGKAYWAVQFLGHKDKASKYFYEIDIFKPGLARRKILFSDYCQSVDITNADLFKDGVCISASIDSLSRFVGDDQLLIYYMRVLEDEKGTDNIQSNEIGKSRRVTKKTFDKKRSRSKGAASQAAGAGENKPQLKNIDSSI